MTSNPGSSSATGPGRRLNREIKGDLKDYINILILGKFNGNLDHSLDLLTDSEFGTFGSFEDHTKEYPNNQTVINFENKSYLFWIPLSLHQKKRMQGIKHKIGDKSMTDEELCKRLDAIIYLYDLREMAVLSDALIVMETIKKWTDYKDPKFGQLPKLLLGRKFTCNDGFSQVISEDQLNTVFGQLGPGWSKEKLNPNYSEEKHKEENNKFRTVIMRKAFTFNKTQPKN